MTGNRRDAGGGAAVTIGLFDWVDTDGGRDAGQLYRERLDLLADAESGGFDVYHLAEHHGTPLGLVPSPSVFMAAAAMRTIRIRLCPLVYVLPMYHPVRLTEEIAMLDQLSNGRLEVGFGKGGNPYELFGYGIEPAQAQRLYDEALTSVLGMLESGVVPGPGKATEQASGQATRNGPVSTELPIRPVQTPYPPIWYPSSNPQSVPLLGTKGINTILGFSFRSPTIEETRLRRDEYFAGAATAPPNVKMGGAGAPTPRFGMMRNIYVGESDREARELAITAMSVFYQQFSNLWRRYGDKRYTGPLDFGQAIDQGLVIAGSAATVRGRLTEMMGASGCNHFVGAFAFGSLTYAQARSSLTRFAEEVAPALRALGPA